MKEEKHKEVNEPTAGYGANKIRIFPSFEEMNEADAREMAQFTPEEHLRHATELIQITCAEELKKKFSDFTIHFK